MDLIFTIIAALIHVYIFVLESLLWGSPKTNKVFNTNSEIAEYNRTFAFNQGFYNLFLALGAIAGVVMVQTGQTVVGQTLMIFCCLSMVGAAVVLVISPAKLWRAAMIQGGPPTLALIGFLILK